ncbi:MAG: hypothetical protein HYY85_05205, partial [Deltaproteobacteria bacterium]|nr:hypothetical protein [Deltaproteobacteria bacterium]
MRGGSTFLRRRCLRGPGFLLLAVLLLLAPAFLGRIPAPADLLYEQFFPWKALKPGVRAQHPAMSDPIRQFIPLTNYAFERWRDGTPPLWNPLIVAGTPEAGAGLSGAFYPLNILYLLGNWSLARTLDLGLHLFLAMAFMHLLLRRLGCSGFGATLGGIVYGLSATTVLWHYTPTLHVMVWSPLAWYFIEQIFQRARPGAVIGLGCALGLQVLVGYAETILFHLLLTSLYVVLRAFWWLRGLRGQATPASVAGGLLLAAGLALLLSAAQWVPLLEVRAESHRATRTFEDLQFMSPLAAATLVSPRIFGSPVDHNWVGPGTHFGLLIYIGIAPLLLAVGAARWRKVWPTRGMLVLLLLVALLALRTPLSWLFYQVFPPLAQLRFLSRMINLFPLPLSILAGIGATELEARLRREEFRQAVARRLSWARLGALAAILAIGLGGGYLLQDLFFGLALKLVERTRPVVVTGDIHGKFRAFFGYEVQQLALAAALLLGSLLLLRLRAGSTLREGAFAPAVLFLALGDLMLFAVHWNPMVDPRRLPPFPTPPAVQRLKADTDLFRVMPIDRYGDIYPDLPFPPNTLLPYGLQSVNGYNSFLPRRTVELMGVLGFWGRPGLQRYVGIPWISVTSPGSPRGAALFQARYLVTRPGDEPPPLPEARLIYRGEVNLYQVPTP